MFMMQELDTYNPIQGAHFLNEELGMCWGVDWQDGVCLIWCQV